MKYDIKRYKPCKEALKWYASQDTFQKAWQNCHRGDWMLWFAAKLRVEERIIVLTGGYCAKTVLHLMKDQRSRNAVQVAINYGEGRTSTERLAAADAAAYAAAYAAYAAYAAAAADAAAHAAHAAAAAAAYAADAAAYAAAHTAAADAAADAAAYAAADAAAHAVNTGQTVHTADVAREKNLQETADICRRYLTDAVFEIVNAQEEREL